MKKYNFVFDSMEQKSFRTPAKDSIGRTSIDLDLNDLNISIHGDIIIRVN